MNASRLYRLAAVAAGFAVAGTLAASAAGNGVGNQTYTVHNLVSNVPGLADRTDPNLVNGWGITAGPTTPWWVADNGTDKSTLYNGGGVPFPIANPLVVDVAGGPTGTVFNSTTDFEVRDGTKHGAARFLFASEDGAVRGWNPAVSPTTALVGAAVPDAIYKGLAIGSSGGANFLYATNFHAARVDVFDRSFNLVDAPGAFVDPSIPAGFAPFGIQNIAGTLYVTYGKQDADAEDEVDAQSLGFVDRFATDGTFLGRIATRGQLDAPWGLAWAPADFGRFGGDLLVGNFGNGRINAYEQLPDGSFAHRGELRDAGHKAITIDGLWGIGFGNGANSGPTNTLYFAAGPNDEADGLFGSIAAR